MMWFHLIFIKCQELVLIDIFFHKLVLMYENYIQLYMIKVLYTYILIVKIPFLGLPENYKIQNVNVVGNI